MSGQGNSPDNLFTKFKLVRHTTENREYDKPTALQLEMRKHRKKVEDMEEKKMLDKETREVWDE